MGARMLPCAWALRGLLRFVERSLPRRRQDTRCFMFDGMYVVLEDALGSARLRGWKMESGEMYFTFRWTKQDVGTWKPAQNIHVHKWEPAQEWRNEWK